MKLFVARQPKHCIRDIKHSTWLNIFNTSAPSKPTSYRISAHPFSLRYSQGNTNKEGKVFLVRIKYFTWVPHAPSSDVSGYYRIVRI